MDTIIPAQHSKVVKIPKSSKEPKELSTKHTNKSKNKEKELKKHYKRQEDSDSSSSDSTTSEDESERTNSDSETESSSDNETKISESKKVKQKQRRIKRTHNPNVEFIEQPSEKDLKDVLMKEINEEIDLNKKLSRHKKRLLKKSKEKSLKESFVLKLKHVKETFHKKTVLIPLIIIVVLCVIGGIIYYINKKHPGFFKHIKEFITRKKHSEKTEKIFN